MSSPSSLKMVGRVVATTALLIYGFTPSSMAFPLKVGSLVTNLYQLREIGELSAFGDSIGVTFTCSEVFEESSFSENQKQFFKKHNINPSASFAVSYVYVGSFTSNVFSFVVTDQKFSDIVSPERKFSFVGLTNGTLFTSGQKGGGNTNAATSANASIFENNPLQFGIRANEGLFPLRIVLMGDILNKGIPMLTNSRSAFSQSGDINRHSAPSYSKNTQETIEATDKDSNVTALLESESSDSGSFLYTVSRYGKTQFKMRISDIHLVDNPLEVHSAIWKRLLPTQDTYVSFYNGKTNISYRARSFNAHNISASINVADEFVHLRNKNASFVWRIILCVSIFLSICAIVAYMYKKRTQNEQQ